MVETGQNLFILAKTVPLRPYMVARGIDFKSEKPGALAFCPFHSHNGKTPSLGVKSKNGSELFNCFACGAAGDIVKFVEKLDSLPPISAAKKVLDDNGVAYIDDGKEVSAEDKARIEKENAKRQKEYAAVQRKKAAEENKQKEKTRSRLAIDGPKYANLLHDIYSEVHEKVTAKFPNRSPIFEDYKDLYLGYDGEQQSLVIINRDGDTYNNTKHYQKFEWDGQSYTAERKSGKWISAYYGTISPFPIDYFRDHADNRVIICEGEKDALNLLSYGVNTLTLGGVTNSWDEHKELLRGKSVFIWFDNDAAGYVNAVKQYAIIKEVAADIFYVPFFKINAGFENGYDISDYLNDTAYKIEDADSIFHNIAYSAFKLTNELVEEIGEFVGFDMRDFITLSPTHTFLQIKREWLKSDVNGNMSHIVKVRGEMDDEEVDATIAELKEAKKGEGYEKFKLVMSNVLFNQEGKQKEADELFNLIDRALDIKMKLVTQYRQTHIVDMFQAFLVMAKKSGFTFGEYRGQLAVWTGTHYLVLEDVLVSKFIHRDWMFHAKVDYKKQTKANVDQIVENVLSKAIHLDEIKQHQERRVINLLNGTLFISKKGKTTFKEMHDKKDAATNLLQFKYDETATAPKWRKFLNRVLPDKDDQAVLVEFMGYCLLPGHDYEAFLFLYGKSGANGKSVILDVIKSFFGDDNVSALQLQQFAGHELHALNNKILNIGSEIDPKGLDKGQLPTLKALVSPKDGVQINPKNKDSYTMSAEEKPKLAFAGNTKPKQGLDDAVFRRMILLSFDEEIKDDEKIRDLSDRFSDESSGIFNMALEGMHRLIVNGKFTKSAKMKAELESYKDEVNPIRSYIKDSVKLDGDVMVAKKMMYAHYRTWAEEKGNMPLSEQRFWNRLKDEMPAIDTSGEQIRMAKAYHGQERPRFVKGVYLKGDDIVSFFHDKEEVQTATINFDIETKEVTLDQNE